MSHQLEVQTDGAAWPTYEIVFDGGSLGNPGRGYGSYQITGPTGLIAHERLTFGDYVTNNEAEYLTLIAAVRDLKERLGASSSQVHLIVRGDSQLVVNQVSGRWKVKKAELMPLRQEAVTLLRQFGDVDLGWHRRANTVKLLGH